jgi:serine phosphatase RsbU (regulator of sigma subunit)
MLLPVSFGYAIFRYQLMDVSMIIRNTVTYGTATIMLAVIYLLSMYGLGQSIGRAIGTEYQGLIAAVTFVLFALLFQSTKDYFQDLLTKKFYPEQYFYQQALSNFNQELANIVGLDNIFDSIHHTFVNELKVERFALFLKRNTGGCRAVRCHKLQVDRLVLTRNPETLDDYVDTLRTNKSRLYIDQQHFIEAFPDNAETFIEQQIYTIVPLVIKTRVIGFIALGLKHSGTQFGGQDLDLLTSVASQAAISIENARLYEAEAEKIKLEHDLEVARQIQQSLLPVELPSANGIDIYGEMIPAMRIGGDYYDIIPVDENRFYTLVGDVSGKGLSAALYMTKLQTMLRLFCKSGDSPDVILKEINKKLYEQMNRGWFITISLALIDRKNKTISFSRAGHMPTLLFEGSSIREYKSRGMAIGLDKGPIFDRTISVETVSLKPGQIFFFYSDGVNETMNEKEELFGEERIQQILITHHKKTPKEITASLWESLRNFQLDYEQHDDITTVIIKVN